MTRSTLETIVYPDISHAFLSSFDIGEMTQASRPAAFMPCPRTASTRGPSVGTNLPAAAPCGVDPATLPSHAHALPQPPFPQQTPWPAAGPYQQSAMPGSMHHSSAQGHQETFGHPYSLDVGAAPAQHPGMHQHMFPGHQQSMGHICDAGSVFGASGSAPQPWWWEQQQQYQQLRLPTPQHMIPQPAPLPPWLAVGGQPQGMTAAAMGFGHGPVLSPPSAVFVGPQPVSAYQRPSAAHFPQQGPAMSPMVVTLSAAQPMPAHQHPLTPNSEFLQHGLPASGAYGPLPPGFGSRVNAGQWSSGIACGTPVDQRFVAAVPIAMPPGGLMRQEAGVPISVPPAPAAPAAALPGPEHPALRQQQGAHQPRPRPASASPAATPAVRQPDTRPRRHVAAAEPALRPAPDAGCAETVSDGLEKDGNRDAARQRRAADAETGDARGFAFDNITAYAQCFAIRIMLKGTISRLQTLLASTLIMISLTAADCDRMPCSGKGDAPVLSC